MNFKEWLEHIEGKKLAQIPGVPSMRGARLMAKGAVRPASMSNLSIDKTSPYKTKFAGMSITGPVYKDVKPSVHKTNNKF